MDFSRELTKEEETKLKSIERRLKKIDAEIYKLGFNVVEHGGNIQILEGKPWDEKGNRRYGCERYNIDRLKSGWDTIDW